MKKDFNIILLFLLLISYIQPQLTDTEREYLLKKYTKKIIINKKNHLTPFNSFYYEPSDITYESSKIKEIINKYNFPESYNFIEDTKASINIKDQKSCGSCWAFASTTALAYRYHKLGIEVDLSPQDLISCYLKSCDTGDYIINSQFAIIKNGIVTEECLPYSSSNGKYIESCPSKCKNGEKIKKYYAKNAYSAQLDYGKEEYYDIVTIIIDQLINYGPVISAIDCYKDFQELMGATNCINTIYKYDGVSEFSGGHAIVIIGYGYEKSKYYWLIQNSWGKNFCFDGFAKVEFSQIGIENVAFAEPFIPENENSSNSNEISVKFTLDETCRLKYTTTNDNYDNSFEMRFKNVENSTLQIYYQCNLSPINDRNEGICNYDFNVFFNSRGYYKYYNYNSLHNNNKFNLDFSSLQNNQFYYYGTDYIGCLYKENYYISEEGSGILLLYEPTTDEKIISKIYPNKNILKELNDCKILPENFYEDYYLIYCKIKKDEISYFGYNSNLPLTYDILCGSKEPMDAKVNMLDKTKYPVYRVQKLILPEGSSIRYNSEFIILANIEGSISGIKNGDNIFLSLINIKRNNQNFIDYLMCFIDKPSEKQNDFKIYCYFLAYKLTRSYITYDSIYLTTYYSPMEIASPYEIIIEKNITGVKYETEIKYDYNDDDEEPKVYRKSESKGIKVSFLLIAILLLFL